MKILLFLGIFTVCCGSCLNAQTITHADGSVLITKYCYGDTSYQLIGQPAGGSFSGCGMYQQNGLWYFNPVTATQGISVFPYQCSISYTINNQTVSRNILIYKPVMIDPPLQDTVTCNGDFYLHATTMYAGAYNYQWTPAGYLSQPALPNTPGHIEQNQTFVLTATDVTSGCTGSDTIVVTRSFPPQITAGSDTTVLPHQSVQLRASGGIGYQWSPDTWLDDVRTATPVATPQEDISYTVTGINKDGCSGTSVIHIHLLENSFLPNAFSPNGDGRNDEFKIENFGYQKLAGFRIFNRYGQQIFFTMDGSKGWNGTQNGKVCEAGTYFYLIQLNYPGGKMSTIKGNLTLIR